MKNYRRLRSLTILILFFLCAIPSQAAVYRVDKDHTLVSFKIRNFISDIQGFFYDFQGTLNYDPDHPEAWASSGTILVQSIDTKNHARDHHLLSGDFFDAEKFKEISFTTLKVTPDGKNGAQAEGLLTIRGIQKPVMIHIENLVLSRDGHGAGHLRFTASARIKRSDFGMKYSMAGSGNMILADDAVITIQAEAVQT